MKLFQIEEPDGSPLEAEGPGAAVGIHVTSRDGAVAVAVGGNAEILTGADGAPRLARDSSVEALILALRARAEKALAQPVTHAVIAAESAESMAPTLRQAAASAGIVVLRLIDAAAAAALARGAGFGDAPVLGAAIQAEDDAAPLRPR